MNAKLSIAALSLALFAASAFATTTPAASTDPAASAAPAATPATPKKTAASKPHHAKLHCKAGEAAVKGKCEKKPA